MKAPLIKSYNPLPKGYRLLDSDEVILTGDYLKLKCNFFRKDLTNIKNWSLAVCSVGKHVYNFEIFYYIRKTS